MKYRVTRPVNLASFTKLKKPLKVGKSKIFNEYPKEFKNDPGHVIEKVEPEPKKAILETKTGEEIKKGWRVTYPINFATPPAGVKLPLKQGESRIYKKFPIWIRGPYIKPYRHLFVIEVIGAENKPGPKKK